jgi:hypothetical protein
MQDILPEAVLLALRDHYYAGVKQAELGFKYGAADEEALTGALGQALVIPSPRILMTTDGAVYGWTVSHQVIGGKGKDADESFLGADGIFELQAFDKSGEVIRRKGLLFQSKKRWRGRNQKLLGQAQKLIRYSPSAVVLNYTPSGYDVVSAGDVIRAEGNRKNLPPESATSLAKVLGDEFVYCRRGDVGLVWSSDPHILYRDGEMLYSRDLTIKHVMTTRVREVTLRPGGGRFL